MAGVHVAQSGMSDTGNQPASKVVWARKADAAFPEPVIAGLRKFRSAKQKVSMAMSVATAPWDATDSGWGQDPTRQHGKVCATTSSQRLRFTSRASRRNVPERIRLQIGRGSRSQWQPSTSLGLGRKRKNLF